MFANHLAILKTLLCHPKPIGPNGTLVVDLLDQILLNQQTSFFVIRMKKIAMVHNICCQMVTLQQKLWGCLFSSAIMNNRLFEYLKLVQLSIVVVLGSIENEKT